MSLINIEPHESPGSPNSANYIVIYTQFNEIDSTIFLILPRFAWELNIAIQMMIFHNNILGQRITCFLPLHKHVANLWKVNPTFNIDTSSGKEQGRGQKDLTRGPSLYGTLHLRLNDDASQTRHSNMYVSINTCTSYTNMMISYSIENFVRFCNENVDAIFFWRIMGTMTFCICEQISYYFICYVS